MMQGLHPQQQQLAALLAAALPKDASASTAAPAATADDLDSSRLAAINSLHRAIVYPPNSLLVAHSASFLAQGFSQLLSEKSYTVRQSAVLAYAALCAVVSSIPVGSIARQNHLMLGTLVDRFIAWALPLLTNVAAGDGTTELALEGLREFLNVGDVGGIERYALPILKACQQLLEDERTSLNLLHRLLPTLTLISLKFSRLFQPHFLDIVDLLLGWAMLPDFSESDRRVIMESFMQFQKHWVANLQFSLGLLSKFLGDMDVLLQDDTNGGSQHLRRLLALLSCFSTVLQSTASGLLEINLLEQIIEPLSKMLPRLLGCLSIVGQRFGWSIWIGDLWKCLTLLAEILCERFSTFYPLAVDILLQSLDPGSSAQSFKSGKMTSLQVHGVLKTNLQLLSLQKFGLMPSSVQKILKFNSPISQLRLHPNHLVTGSLAATYVFLLQHGDDEIVQQAITLLTEELEHLKALLGKTLQDAEAADSVKDSGTYTKFELFALFKFDLKVLLTSISMEGCNNSMPNFNLYMKRLDKMVSFIIEKLNPFDSPIQAVLELQVRIFKTLSWLSMVKFSSRYSLPNQTCNKGHIDIATGKVFFGNSSRNGHMSIVVDHFKEFGDTIIKALQFSSPLSVKLVALEWVQKLCEDLFSIDGNSSTNINPFEDSGYVGLLGNITFAVLEAGFDQEPKVRLSTAQVLLLLLQSKLVHPVHLYSLAEAILEKLGDPDIEVRNAFLRLLSDALPTTVYICGLFDYGTYTTRRPRILMVGTDAELYWKQAFALKPLPQQLHSQQLVSVLSYISQRWKVPLSSWIQRFVHTCRSSKECVLGQLEDTSDGGLWLDIKVDEEILGKLCSVNNLAGAWWAIHEAARFCTSTRLRTNLGGPTQTFAAIERMLLDIALLLQIDNEESDGGLSIIGSSAAHLLPMRLLLDFVEALKKNIYNAYEGSVVFPCPSRQSTLFFRTNRKVCEEWFSRICEPMMNAGLALQCHDAAIQYCNLRLMELNNLTTTSSKEKHLTQGAENLQSVNGRVLGDALRILRSMTLSMCRNHESEALIGIQKWVSMKFSSLLFDENQENSTSVLRPLQWITGLIYQAEGCYEKAAAYFSHLLEDEESLSTMGSDGVQFAIARIIENYSALCDWKSLETWLIELQMLRSKFAGKSYSGALTTAGNEMNEIHALACFDEGDFQASWAYLDLTPKSSSELTLDPRLSLQRSEQMLLQALLHYDGNVNTVPHDLQKAKLILEEVLSAIPFDGLPEAASYATQLQCISAVEEGCELRVNHNQTKHTHSILNSYVLSTDSLIKEQYQDCSQWLKVLRVYRTISQTAPFTLKLSMDMLRLARKQGNYMLAKRLHRFLGDNVPNCSDESYRDMLASSLQYQEILLMFAEKKIEEAFENICSFLSPTLSVSDCTVKSIGGNVLKAKACLKLSCWLREDLRGLNLKSSILKMHKELDVGGFSSAGANPFLDRNISSNSDFHVIVEELVGGLTKLSTQLCPTMGKAWICYACWCFSQAKNLRAHLCDKHCQPSFYSPFVPEQTLGRFKLNEDEIKMVEFEIMKLFKGSDINDLNDEREAWSIEPNKLLRTDIHLGDLLKKVVDVIETIVGESGAESIDRERISSTLASRLLNVLQHANVGVETTTLTSVVDKLVEFRWLVRQRRMSLFGHAARGFIEYLSYSSSRLSDCQFLDTDFEPVRQRTGSYTLRATLYVLRILLNHGVELKETLEPSLSTVPLLPWQEVTPQLFARLNSHPSKVVRKQMEGLLMRLAKQSPWSIVYPTLVDVNAYEEHCSEELQHILGCLSELYPRLVQDVQLMIDELGNVTVLWEELWLSTLQDLHTDVIRRINVLKEEAARIAENSTLSQSEKKKINVAKYSAVMAPIVVALERRLASTSRKPETPHESWFHQEYREQLKAAVLTFKTPPVSASALEDVWRPFENIAASLASQQRTSSIAFQEVAPRLAVLSSSEIPMPGVMKQHKAIGSDKSLSLTLEGVVTITSFSPQVTILSTKTKPKKLVMLGSDGNMYTYLLKGREDLRLDARIMQLLQAVNSFLRSSSETQHQALGIRYYSVTPISGRAGLIQWVDNVISIYSIFKSWQNRAQLYALGAGNAKCSVPPPVPRPSDMFYGKIIPALKEKGIRRVISRRDWPHEVKRKVLLDLMKEVPRQLLHQELWCASEGFKAFSSKLKRYSGSLATMSMVGHILGLGDRHLDNILLDFSSGEVVHIDYNVCFDRGQRLKVPEIVPFRLTQTIEAALGLTGIEGTFRANCEAVIGVLRKNKDVILMLLEVFVWDPLVEWTRGDFHDDSAIGGEERKGMELAVSLSLFATRVQEIRVPLQEHRDLLLGTLPAVESSLERFSDILAQYELVSSLFDQADEERSNLVQHETSAKSVVAEVTGISEKIHALFAVQEREFAQAKTLVAEKAQEASKWIEQHGKILDALRSNLIPEIKASINMSTLSDQISLTSAVLAAGVPLTIVPEPTLAQCHDIDQEISHLISELDNGLSSAVIGVQAYSLALQRILPLNYLTTSAVHGWTHVLELSVNTLSSEVLSLARRQAAELIARMQGDNPDLIKMRHDDLCVKVEKYAIEIQKLREESSELVSSISSDNEQKAKERLLASLMQYMKSADSLRKEDISPFLQFRESIGDGTKDGGSKEELKDSKRKFFSVVSAAAILLYTDIGHRVIDIVGGIDTGKNENNILPFDIGTIFSMFEEQVEKCVLVVGFVNELGQHIVSERPGHVSNTFLSCHSVDNPGEIFRTALVACKSFIGQMAEFELADVMRFAISFNTEVMDAFGLISQVKGTIDTALERLIELELDRASLAELEQNYFVKVGLITEKQLALEEAAVKGRDHLSWEEAEELASQEEACRAQLDALHQSWNRKDTQTTSLKKKEAEILSSFISCEQQFQSLLSVEEEHADPHCSRSKALLHILARPLSELESVDKMLSSSVVSGSSHPAAISNLFNLIGCGNLTSELLWNSGSLLDDHSFFIWKIDVLDSIIGCCLHDIASYIDQNLGFEQIFDVVKRKLEIQLQEQVGRYLKQRLAPALRSWLDKETERLKLLTDGAKEPGNDLMKKDTMSVRNVQTMLQEYCNSFETVRAARSAASIMKKQENELKETLRKCILEIVQMEWMHDFALPQSHDSRTMFQNFFGSDELHPIILNLQRQSLLDCIQSSVMKLTRSIECLQSCEQTYIAAEGQLERAMEWACGGPNSGSTGISSSKASGIPPQFHKHLRRRRHLLSEATEKASNIVNLCISILEFEASRDGMFQVTGEAYPCRTNGETMNWQQAYFSALTRLDVTYHSFTRTEQELKLAQSSVESASNSLYSATNELSVALCKAKSASGDIQSTVLVMRDCAYDASVSLSAFARVSKGHTALTSESGSMLEEVLAITEDLHDIHKLGKEAAAVHRAFMEGLLKINSILLPLDSVLSKDVAAMTEAISREKETKIEVSPIHGQAIYQSYCSRVREACRIIKQWIPSLVASVEELHSLLNQLALSASLHAGNLNKAHEGAGETQGVKSQEVCLAKPDFAAVTAKSGDMGRHILSQSDGDNYKDVSGSEGLSLREKEWISPANSLESSTAEFSFTSTGANYPDTLSAQAYLISGNLSNHSDIMDAQEELKSVVASQNDEILHPKQPEVSEMKSELDVLEIYLKAVEHAMDEAINGAAEPPNTLNKDILKKSGDTYVVSIGTDIQENPVPHTLVASTFVRGKNAYAVSVLERVESKLDGRKVVENREMSVAEQVDSLLKQATSIDNLCCMYEGWTPWI